MKAFTPARRSHQISAAALTVALALAAPALCPTPGIAQPARAAQAIRPIAQQPHPKNQQNQEHLAQWMEHHRNLPLPEQQRALQGEPGFRELPSETQQRMRERLAQLNNMPPEQRRRALARTETMEHLSPQQRQQFRSAVGELHGLPVDRRRALGRAFRELREMPQPQRQALLDSDRFRGQFSEQERGTLSSLLAVEPYLPAKVPNDNPDPGKP